MMTAVQRRDEITIADVLGIARRQRTLVLAGALVGAALGLGYATVATPQYEATTTLRIQSRQANLPAVISAAELRDEVVTEIEELRSRTLAEHVTSSLGLQLEVSGPAAARRTEVVQQLTIEEGAPAAEYTVRRRDDGRFEVTSPGLPDQIVRPGGRVELRGASFVLGPAAPEYEAFDLELVDRESAVEALREAVRVTRPSSDGNIIALRYRNPDAQLARAVLSAWTDRYVATRRDVQQGETRSLVEFLRVQLDTLQRELAVAQESLREFREREGVLDPALETAAEVTGGAELQAQRAMLEAERQALAQLMAGVRTADGSGDSDAAYRRLIAFPPLMRTQATSELLRSLAQIEAEEAALRQRRTEADPDVQVLIGRRRQLESQLRGIAETYLAGLEAQVTGLDRALAASRARADRIPARDVEYARLHRAPEVLTELVTLMETRLKEAEIAQAAHQPGMRVVDAAHTGSVPASPRRSLDLAFGLLFGLMAGLVGAVARDWFDRSVHTLGHVEAITGTPVLGLIPRLNGRARTMVPRRAPIIVPRNGQDRAHAMAVEAYARLHLNVSAVSEAGDERTLLVTSPLPGDGKTTTAKNLAVSLVARGYRTLLIDADLRHGVVHRQLGGRRAPGVTNVLMGVASYDEVLRRVESGKGELHYIAAGTRSDRVAELLRSDHLAELVERGKAEHDAVILDSPPLNLVSDAVLLADLVDGVLVVVRAGTTAREAIDFSMRQLRMVGAPVLGTVLNDIDPARESTYDGSYRYLGFTDHSYFTEAR